MNVDAKSELVEIRERAGELENLCRFLVDLPIPCTLIHGDLDFSNILKSVNPKSLEALNLSTKSWNEIRFIDWTECCVSHPFLDYVRLTEIGWEAIEDDDAKSAYLNKWRKYGDEKTIKLASVAARPLMYVLLLYRVCRFYKFSKSARFEREVYVETMNNGPGEILQVLNSTIEELRSTGEGSTVLSYIGA